MIIAALLFYLFAAICVLSGVMVVTARNPVHSVLYLILAFFNAAGLFVLIGAEFLAFMLVIVYVGAVAVLFLFVVMMLDVDFADLRRGVKRNLAVGLIVGLVLLAELVLVAGGWVATPNSAQLVALATPAGTTNTQALGALIYTHYAYAFQAAGLVLLVAMIGAIVLTLRHRRDTKRQDIGSQINRERSVHLVKVTSGAGVELADLALPTLHKETSP
jgi:NADH-quinone oxidoreductase subunit J